MSQRRKRTAKRTLGNACNRTWVYCSENWRTADEQIYDFCASFINLGAYNHEQEPKLDVLFHHHWFSGLTSDRKNNFNQISNVQEQEVRVDASKVTGTV